MNKVPNVEQSKTLWQALFARKKPAIGMRSEPTTVSRTDTNSATGFISLKGKMILPVPPIHRMCIVGKKVGPAWGAPVLVIAYCPCNSMQTGKMSSK
jgi:hypothetical protein